MKNNVGMIKSSLDRNYLISIHQNLGKMHTSIGNYIKIDENIQEI